MLTRLKKPDTVWGMDDEVIREVVDWTGDPETLVNKTLTPKALEKLWSQLDSDNPSAVDKAIDKVIAIDKRLRKDAPPQGNTLNVFGQFDPGYLKSVGEGLRQLFGGPPSDVIEVPALDEPVVTPRKGKGIHRKRLEGQVDDK